MKLMYCVKIDCNFVEVAFKDWSDFRLISKYRARRPRKEEQGDTFLLKRTPEQDYKMSRPNVQKILYKNVQLVCLS